MPGLFDKMGIRFQYPENWTLEVENASIGELALTVTSPIGAFWSLAMHPLEADLQELADIVLAAMQQEYKGLEEEAVTEEIQGHELVGRNMNFFYLDLVSTAQVRAFHTATATLVIHCQAEDREFAQLDKVFQAMLISLLTSSAA